MFDDLCLKDGEQLMEYFEKIAGSHEYKAQYEEKMAELTRLEEQKREISDDIKNRKRELKQVSKHIKNGDVYHKIIKEFDNLMVDSTLAQLLECDVRSTSALKRINQIEQEIKSKDEMIDELTKELREVISNNRRTGDTQTNQRTFESKLRDLGKLHEKKLSVEDKRNELNGALTAYEKGEEILSNRLEQARQNEQETEKAIEEASKKQDVLELTDIDEENRDAVREFLQLAKGRQQFEEVRLSKELVRKEEEVLKMQEEIEINSNTIDELQGQNTLKERAILAKRRELEVMNRRMGVMKEEFDELSNRNTDPESKQEDLKELKKKLTTTEILMERLKAKLGDSNKQSELVKHLFENVSGFKGRFGDIVQPIHQRFRIAKKVLLGAASNYLVVDNDQTADLVNDILKERFCQRTVISLDSIPKISRDRITKFRAKISGIGSAGFDIVTTDSKNVEFDGAIRYFMINKVCCENMDKANAARQALGKKSTVVTTRGDQLKGFNISTVGSREKYLLEDKNKREELEGRLADLEAKRAEIIEDVNKLLSEEEELKLENLSLRIDELGLVIKRVETTIEMDEDKQRSNNNEIDKKNASNNLLKTEIEALKSEMEPIRSKRKDLTEARVNDETKHILLFLKQKDIKNAKDIAPVVLDIMHKDLILAFSLEQTINFLKNKKRSYDVVGKEERLEEASLRVQETKKEIEDLKKEMNTLEDQIQEMREEIEEEKVKMEEKKKEKMKQTKQEETLRRDLRALSSSIDELRAEMRRRRTELQTCNRAKEQIIDEKEIEGVDIPRLSRQKDIDYEPLEERIKEGAYEIILEDIEDLADGGGSTLLTILQPESASSLRRQLSDKYKQASIEMNKHCSKFFSDQFIDKEKLKEVELQTKLKDLRAQVRDDFSSIDGLKNSIEKLKKLRNDKFMDLYMRVSTRVNEVYQQLCGDKRASASMYLESHDDPCSGKLTFQATPPNKKFVFDPQSLSGGEKALASLALFFSINEALRSPLILLDEADSPFDFHNGSLYGLSLKRISFKRQCILISHNYHIFKHSNILLGIALTRDDEDQKAAKCYSLALA